jgi:hypothetical protein
MSNTIRFYVIPLKSYIDSCATDSWATLVRADRANPVIDGRTTRLYDSLLNGQQAENASPEAG